jgi:hypothetical protein
MGAHVALPKELQVHRLRREVVVALDRLGVLALRQNNPVYHLKAVGLAVLPQCLKLLTEGIARGGLLLRAHPAI